MRALFARRPGVALVALTLGALPARAQTIAITGGKVYPVSGPALENGTVIIRDGKIVAVGRDIAIPSGAQRVDATGKWVTPGLVNAATQLGVVEVGAVADTRQTTARGRGDGINAAFTVWSGINPASVLLPPTRDDGITSVIVSPSGGLISGQAAAVDVLSTSMADMLLKAPVAMIGQIGDPSAARLGARGEVIVRLRELLEDTRVYMRRRAEFERAQTRPFIGSRLDLDAMIPVVEGKLPLVLDADMASDIEAALRIAKDYGIKLIIGSGAEAWKVAGELAAAKVPVLTGAMSNIPTSFATLGSRQQNAALLRKAGVQVVLIGNSGAGEEAFNVRNIRQEAGNAIAYGMSWDDALRAVTLGPAEVFGIADRVGSLQAGREANVVVWSADPFEFGTRAEQVFIRGKRIEEKSRQDLLTERYRKLPPDYSKP